MIKGFIFAYRSVSILAGDGLTERGGEESGAAEKLRPKKSREWDLEKSRDPQQVGYSAAPFRNFALLSWTECAVPPKYDFALSS